MTRVSLDELQEAYDFTCFDVNGDNVAYVCRRTGEIHWCSPELDLDDVPEDVEDPRLYAAVPDQRELGLGRNLALEFVASQVPHLFDRIAECFRSAGAYARFKDLLHEEGVLETWYTFEARRVAEALRDWCEEEGFELEGVTTNGLTPDASEDPAVHSDERNSGGRRAGTDVARPE